MLKKIQLIFFALSYTALFLFSLNACDNSAEESMAKKISLGKSASKSKSEEVPYEDYTDVAQWAEPRLQFSRDTDELGFTIYSSKIDGSDVRIAYSFKNIPEKIGLQSYHTVVRSPNNRYLATTVWNNKTLIIDLHKQNYKVIDGTYGVPMFNWAQDSKSLVYYNRGDLKQYNLETQEIKVIPGNVKASDLYLLKDQKTLLSVMGAHFRYYSLKTGKEIKKRLDVEKSISFKGKRTRGMKTTHLSPDEKHMFYSNEVSRGGVDLKTGKSIFLITNTQQPKKGYITSAIFLNNEEIIYDYMTKLYTFNIFTHKRTLIDNSYYDGDRMTLINTTQAAR